jgi:hypothetical protein
MKGHPNATAAVGSGIGATLIVAAMAYAGLEPDPVLATAVAGALTTVVLLVGRKGISGLARQLWRGSGPEEK